METENFQMFKLDFKKAEESEIKFDQMIKPKIIKKAREFQKSIYFCFIAYAKVLTVWIKTNWKILKEMGVPDHLTCLLRNGYAG